MARLQRATLLQTKYSAFTNGFCTLTFCNLKMRSHKDVEVSMLPDGPVGKSYDLCQMIYRTMVHEFLYIHNLRRDHHCVLCASSFSLYMSRNDLQGSQDFHDNL